jgi:hypothetical protein
MRCKQRNVDLTQLLDCTGKLHTCQIASTSYMHHHCCPNQVILLAGGNTSASPSPQNTIITGLDLQMCHMNYEKLLVMKMLM